MTNVFTAPEPIFDRNYDVPSVFLAGTIDMGSSYDWQMEAAYKLSEQFVVFNPRRKNWDSSWEQSINNRNFTEQVEWELDALDQSDYIIMNFLKESKSPISFLELGIHIDDGKLHVICPEGFYRKGNVDIVCRRYGVPQYNTLDECIEWLLERGTKLDVSIDLSDY
jgi:hypothetical protein